MNQTSLNAYYNINKIHRNKTYQKILGILSDQKPRTREEISTITHVRLQTICGRVNELKQANILISCGEGLTSSNTKAEKLIINI